MELTDAQILAAVTALVAGMPGIIALLMARAKNRAETEKAGADAASVIANTALTLLPVLRQRVSDLDVEVATLRKEQEKQLEITRALEAKVEELKVTITILLNERDAALEKLKYTVQGQS